MTLIETLALIYGLAFSIVFFQLTGDLRQIRDDLRAIRRKMGAGSRDDQ